MFISVKVRDYTQSVKTKQEPVDDDDIFQSVEQVFASTENWTNTFFRNLYSGDSFKFVLHPGGNESVPNQADDYADSRQEETLADKAAFTIVSVPEFEHLMATSTGTYRWAEGEPPTTTNIHVPRLTIIDGFQVIEQPGVVIAGPNHSMRGSAPQMFFKPYANAYYDPETLLIYELNADRTIGSHSWPTEFLGALKRPFSHIPFTTQRVIGYKHAIGDLEDTRPRKIVCLQNVKDRLPGLVHRFDAE